MAAPLSSPLRLGCSRVNSDSETDRHVESRLGYTPRVRPIEEAESEANAISSELLDLMGVLGKVTEPGAAVTPCEDIDPELETHYMVRHPWSIYQLRRGTFAEAMRNLRERLPDHGWDIVKDGETRSMARNPEIVAVHTATHHTAQIEWARKRSGDLEQLISVDVDSLCYRAPEGTSPQGWG